MKKGVVAPQRIFWVFIFFYFLEAVFFSSFFPVFSQDIPESVTRAEVIAEEIIILRAPGIKRFLVLSPEFASARIIFPSQLEVTGLKRGATLIHIWDDSGLRTVRLSVENRQIKLAQQAARRRQEQARRVQNLSFDYKYDYYARRRGPDSHSFKQQSRTDQHKLMLSGPTPHGNLSASALLERRSVSRSAEREVFFNDRDLKFQLLGGSFGPLSNFDFIAGDNYLNLSDLVFQGYRFRGFTYGSAGYADDLRLKDLKHPFSYVLFWGRSELGGTTGVSADYDRKIDSFYTGGRFDYQPFKGLRFYATQINRRGSDDLGRSERTFSFGTLFNWGMLNLEAETAASQDDYAYKLSTEITPFRELRIKGTYRNIRKDFYNTGGRPLNQGIRGGQLNLSFVPTELVTLFAYLDYYQDTLSLNPDNPQRYNLVYHLNPNLRLPLDIMLAVDYRHHDLSGTLSPTRGESLSFRARRPFNFGEWIFVRSLQPYFTYETRKHKNFLYPENNYYNEKKEAGLSVSLPAGFFLTSSYSYNNLKEIYNQLESSPREWRTQLNFSRSFLKLFYLGAYAGYSDVQDTLSRASFLPRQDVFRMGFNFDFRPDPDKSFYLRMNFADYRPQDQSLNRHLDMGLYAGGQVKLDTGVAVLPRANIRGTVFHDLNNNGRRDRGEPGIPEVRVYAGDRSALTNAQGRYSISGVTGAAVEVGIDRDSLAPDVLYAPIGSRRIVISKNKIVSEDFAVSSHTIVRGFVFCDVDENGLYDNNDFGLADITLTLADGSSVKTARNGLYEFKAVGAGANEISVNPFSLPLGYLSFGPAKLKFEIKEGEARRIDFPIRAHRIIVGYVFEDANGDGVFQKGEKVFPGVQVSIGNITAVTDKDGRYILSELRPGSKQVVLNEGTVPLGFIAIRDALPVVLPPGHTTITGFNFPLATKEKLLQIFE